MFLDVNTHKKPADRQSAVHKAASNILSGLLTSPPYLPDNLKSVEVKRRHTILGISPDDPEDYLVTDCYPSSHHSTPAKAIELLRLLNAQVEEDRTMLSDGNAGALFSNIRYRYPEPDYAMMAVDLGVHNDERKPLLTMLLRLEGPQEEYDSFKFDNLLPCDVGPKNWFETLEEARQDKPDANSAHISEQEDHKEQQNDSARSRAYSEARSLASYSTARQPSDIDSRNPSQDTTYIGQENRKSSDLGKSVDESKSDSEQEGRQDGDYYNNPSEFWAGTTSDEDASSRKPQLDDYQQDSESDDTRRKREEVEEEQYWSRYGQDDNDKIDVAANTHGRHLDAVSKRPSDTDEERKRSDDEWYMQRYSPVPESVSGQTMYDVPPNMSLGDLERHHRERDMNHYANARQRMRQVVQQRESPDAEHSNGRSLSSSNTSDDRNVGLKSADSEMQRKRDPIDELSMSELDLVVAARRQANMDKSSPTVVNMDTLRKLVDSGETLPTMARAAAGIGEGGNDRKPQARAKGKSLGVEQSALRENGAEDTFPHRMQYTAQKKANEESIRPNETFLPGAESEASMMVMGTTYGEPNSNSFRSQQRGGRGTSQLQPSRYSQYPDRGDAQDRSIDEETYEMMYDHLQYQRQQANIARERQQQYRHKHDTDRDYHRSYSDDDTAEGDVEDVEDNNSTQRDYGGSATPRTHRSVDANNSPIYGSRRAGSDRTQNSSLSHNSASRPSKRSGVIRGPRLDNRQDSGKAKEEENRSSSRRGDGSAAGSNAKHASSSKRVASNSKLGTQQQQLGETTHQRRTDSVQSSSSSGHDEKSDSAEASRRRNESVKSILKGAWQLLDESEAPIFERSNEEEFMRLAREAMRECIALKRTAPSTAHSGRSGGGTRR